ncbi:hypothetical protein PVAP13_8KG013220 [Panicum virgatum]|uniref:Uncharacterized protein n=1 Tax=Panicum virgatum TaxID=38727 RepID=A0A8T0PE03_PANVG|nr:hypothetical protein PVAP13_8KG013220 [Panicum virgatum]
MELEDDDADTGRRAACGAGRRRRIGFAHAPTASAPAVGAPHPRAERCGRRRRPRSKRRRPRRPPDLGPQTPDPTSPVLDLDPGASGGRRRGFRTCVAVKKVDQPPVRLPAAVP